MKPDNNVLVVDDERSWRKFYEDELHELGVGRVWTVADLADAEEAVEAMRFAVALVDIGLEEKNDRNIDGLRVMEKIRKTGDQTSIIVVTGRSGQDVLPIVRDAMKKFDAHDTVAKKTLKPAQLRDLVQSGIQVYEEATSNERHSLYAALRGNVEQVIWDDQMMGVGASDGGVDALYHMVDELFGRFGPLLTGEPMSVQADDGVALGVFWSRGVGQAITACMGKADRMAPIMDQARVTGMLLERYPVTEILNQYTHGSVRGVVYALAERGRDAFG